jgi:hypothetical protein
MSKNKILPLYVLGEVLLGEGLLGIGASSSSEFEIVIKQSPSTTSCFIKSYSNRLPSSNNSPLNSKL